jgi:hypothetical protein
MSIYQLRECLFIYLRTLEDSPADEPQPDPALAAHPMNETVAAGFQPALSCKMTADLGAGGQSHFVGEPRVGDIDEEFDRWFLAQLESGDLDELLDMPNDELMLAGNGTGEVSAWVTVAGAMRGHKTKSLAYEPICEWINGMGVILDEGDTR